MKPLDEEMIRTLANESDVLVTVEEGSKGGFGDHVLHFLAAEGLLDRGTLRIRNMFIPDIWIEHGTIKEQLDIAELNEPHIVEKVQELIQGIRDYRPSRIIDIKADVVSGYRTYSR